MGEGIARIIAKKETSLFWATKMRKGKERVAAAACGVNWGEGGGGRGEGTVRLPMRVGRETWMKVMKMLIGGLLFQPANTRTFGLCLFPA